MSDCEGITSETVLGTRYCCCVCKVSPDLRWSLTRGLPLMLYLLELALAARLMPSDIFKGGGLIVFGQSSHSGRRQRLPGNERGACYGSQRRNEGEGMTWT